MKKILFILLGCFIFSVGCQDYQANKLYKEAQLQEQQYNWETAEEIYSDLLNKFPKAKIASEAQINLKHCISKQEEIDVLSQEIKDLMEKGKYEKALEKTNELLKLDIDTKKKKDLSDFAEAVTVNAFLEKNEYEKAIEKIEELLKSDNEAVEKDSLINTKLSIAEHYYNEKGNKNKQKAFTLFKELAENNNAYAQYVVGFMLQNGQGTKTNHKEAEEWYKKAAEQGEENAVNELKKIEKIRALDAKTADRKIFDLYALLGKDVIDVISSFGRNGKNYTQYKEYTIDQKTYMCYLFLGQYAVTSPEHLYVCHNKGSKKVVGVKHWYPVSVYNFSNLPLADNIIPKSFRNLEYDIDDDYTELDTGLHEYGGTNKTYYIKNEKWKFSGVRRYDMAGSYMRLYSVSIFLL